MVSSGLIISLNADELAILPRKFSVEELLDCGESCRYELLPEVVLPASVVSEGTIGAVAGSPRANWWSSNPLITMRPVHLCRMLGAYYFPEFGVIIDQEGRAMRSSMYQASYVTPDLAMLPNIRQAEGEILFSSPKALSYLSRAVVTMPWGGNSNYGHFVVDCLSAVSSLRRIDLLRGYDFVFPPLKAWHRDHLHLLGVAPIELPHKCYYVEDAIFTTCMASFLQAPNKNVCLVPEVQRAALGCRTGGSRKVYPSRRDNPKRRFLSEARLEVILGNRGFEIVQPEKMSVRDQIALFSSSAVVVGCTGAAFANALYCAPGSVIVEIQPRTMHEAWVRNICVMMGLKWAPYYCDSREPDKPVVHGGQVRPSVGITFDFDLNEFLAYLDEVAEV